MGIKMAIDLKTKKGKKFKKGSLNAHNAEIKLQRRGQKRNPNVCWLLPRER